MGFARWVAAESRRARRAVQAGVAAGRPTSGGRADGLERTPRAVVSRQPRWARSADTKVAERHVVTDRILRRYPPEGGGHLLGHLPVDRPTAREPQPPAHPHDVRVERDQQGGARISPRPRPRVGIPSPCRTIQRSRDASACTRRRPPDRRGGISGRARGPGRRAKLVNESSQGPAQVRALVPVATEGGAERSMPHEQLADTAQEARRSRVLWNR